MPLSPASPRQLQNAFQRAFFLRALCQGCTVGGFVVGGFFFAWRLLYPSCSHHVLLLSLGILLTLSCLLFWLASQKHLPTQAHCKAILDATSQAGGLLLSSHLPGASSWSLPTLSTSTIPHFHAKRYALKLPLSVLFMALACFLPSSPFQRLHPTPPPPGFRPLIQQTEEKIEFLLAQEILTPEEAEPLRTWLEELASQSPSHDSQSPQALFEEQTLEALDHLNASLDQKQLAATHPSAGVPFSIDPSLVPTNPRFPQLNELPLAQQRLLDGSASEGLASHTQGTAEASNTAQKSLEQFLNEHPSNPSANAVTDSSSSVCSQSGTGVHGTPNNPSAGSPTRGSGHVPLSLGQPSQDPNTLSLKASPLESPPRELDPNDTTPAGHSTSEPTANTTPVAHAPSAVPTFGTPSGSSNTRPSLPRHRTTIQHYFSP